MKRTILALLAALAIVVGIAAPASAGTYQTTTGPLYGGWRTTGTWKDGYGNPTSFAGSYASNVVTTQGSATTLLSKVGVRINYRVGNVYSSTALVTLSYPRLGQGAFVQLWYTNRLFVSAEFWTWTATGTLKKVCYVNRTCTEQWF